MNKGPTPLSLCIKIYLLVPAVPFVLVVRVRTVNVPNCQIVRIPSLSGQCIQFAASRRVPTTGIRCSVSVNCAHSETKEAPARFGHNISGCPSKRGTKTSHMSLCLGDKSGAVSNLLYQTHAKQSCQMPVPSSCKECGQQSLAPRLNCDKLNSPSDQAAT